MVTFSAGETAFPMPAITSCKDCSELSFGRRGFLKTNTLSVSATRSSFVTVSLPGQCTILVTARGTGPFLSTVRKGRES